VTVFQRGRIGSMLTSGRRAPNNGGRPPDRVRARQDGRRCTKTRVAAFMKTRLDRPNSPRRQWLLRIALPLLLLPATGAGATLFTDSAAGPVRFALDELAAAFAARDEQVERRALAEGERQGPLPHVIVTRTAAPAVQAAIAAGTMIAPRALQAEGFSIRIGRDHAAAAPRSVWVIGHDEGGAMYGGLELAETVRTRGLEAATEIDRNPHLVERGVKFNIPLDARTPSYSDASDSAQHNIATVWDIAFWREFIDRLARNRYNLVSLWNLHPFPSLVRVPEYPDIALGGVQRAKGPWRELYTLQATGLDAPEITGNVETLKQLPIGEKIAFWREVMRHARERNVRFYIVTWNIYTNGTGGKYGITPALDNATTADYFRRSVRELVLTYPDLAGIGITTGENMRDATAAEKEAWAFRTYGQGVLDALARQPGRRITFIHRQHEAGAAEIAKAFAPLMAHPGVDFVYSFKYAEAHALSSTRQRFHERFLADIGDRQTLWTVRNDDVYHFRWGAPAFVREFIRNMPVGPTRGFYYGSDQWIWGREFLDLNAPAHAPRPLEIAKHWYHWLLWGRMGYEPDLGDERLIALLQERFPGVDARRLFDAWQDASMIYPLTTGFHWGALDFQWYIEGCHSRPEPAQTPTGFHDVNRFISLGTHPASGNVSIPNYVRAVREGRPASGTTPPQVAARLHTHADRALGALGHTGAGGTTELGRTLDDIRAMAHLGKYYGHKIRAATELALLRATLERPHQEAVASELNQAAYHWRQYASIALAHYRNPLWTNRVGHVDWRRTYTAVLHDLTSTGSPIQVPSMAPTPGGTILEAEDAMTNGPAVAAASTGFTGTGYRDFNRAQGTRWIEWTYDAPAAGDYMLELRYAMRPFGARSGDRGHSPLVINGEPMGEIVLWSTAGLQTWAWDRRIVRLRGGRNTIRLYPAAMPNIDHLNVIPLER
jgi:hypothetical protein